MGNCQTVKTHTVTVTTGDKKSGGAPNINVYATFTDEEGRSSEEIKITTVWTNDLRKGQQEMFHLDLPSLTKITDICIRRDETGTKDVWFIDRMEINYLDVKSKCSIFPFHRWIYSDTMWCITEFDCTLPQQDLYPEQRAKELRQKREKYILVSKIPGAPGQVEDLPEDEEFSNSYEFDIAKTFIKNTIKTSLIDFTTHKFHSLQDMKDLFKKCNLDIPAGIEKWKSDVAFGIQKVAGVNPTLLELCTAIPDYFGATAELVEPHLEGKSLEAAFSDKKMYLIDLRYLAEIECSESRVLPGPSCLLYVNDSGNVVPVAIQLMPEPAEDNPVFTPADPEYTWMSAKMWFNVAEASDHESAKHLGHTHLLVESVAVCTNRQLSPSHPIHRLLAPHFLYVMAINAGAISQLVSVGGWIDKTMHIGRVGMFNIIKRKWSEWNLQDDGNLVKNLKKRGVDDATALPNYPYRDDGLLLWEAINKYVTATVNNVYDTPEKLGADDEIKAWREELVGDAQFKGIPDSFATNEDLIEVLTVFIFTATAVHASVNFGQYDEYAFAPNYPSVMHNVQWPTTKEELNEDYVVQSLPPKKQALDIIFIQRLLSERASNSLGDFLWRYAYGPLLEPPLKEFREQLATAATTVDTRNGARSNVYHYLNAREVPNSISI